MFNTLEQILGADPNNTELQRYSNIGAALSAVLNLFMGISFSMAIIGIAFSAFQYIMSQGDPKRIQKAQDSMIWSIIAAMITLMAFAIKRAVISAVGVTDPNVVNNAPGF